MSIFLMSELVATNMNETKFNPPELDWIGIHDLAKELEWSINLLVQEAAKERLTMCIIGDGLGIYARNDEAHGYEYIPIVHHCAGYPGCIIVLSKTFFENWLNVPDKKLALNHHHFFMYDKSLDNANGYHYQRLYAVNVGDSCFSRTKKYYNAYTINNTNSFNDVIGYPDIEICLNDVVVLRDEKERYLRTLVDNHSISIIKEDMPESSDSIFDLEQEKSFKNNQSNAWRVRAAELCLELRAKSNIKVKVSGICSEVAESLKKENIKGRGGKNFVTGATVEREVWQKLVKEGRVK